MNAKPEAPKKRKVADPAGQFAALERYCGGSGDPRHSKPRTRRWAVLPERRTRRSPPWGSKAHDEPLVTLSGTGCHGRCCRCGRSASLGTVASEAEAQVPRVEKVSRDGQRNGVSDRPAAALGRARFRRVTTPRP